MAEPAVHTGRCAAAGLAVARIFVSGEARDSSRKQGTPAQEKESLQGAVSAAAAQLRELSAQAQGAGAEMLEFQADMLDDPETCEDALARIAGGAAADAAWEQALAEQIAEYAADSDEAFSARAADLEDMRDRVLRALRSELHDAYPQGCIIHANDVKPSEFLSADLRGGGLALAAGSPAGHVAILARAQGIPMVTGLGWHPEANGRAGLLDAERGTLTVDPDDAARKAHEEREREAAASAQDAQMHLRAPAQTRAGERVRVMVNAAAPADLAQLDPECCDGIGLARTEFLFAGALAGEEDQYACYRTLAQWAAGRPIVLRTLDAGGDKPIAGYTLPDERNPFLGVRGLRLSLRHPDIFRAQLRAMLRAAADGDVRIMLPMVTVPAELAAAREHLARAREELAAAGAAHGSAELGIMIEVPAAALALASFDADFYSIGSNDLLQYATACSRDEGTLADLADSASPALLELIARTVDEGKRQGAPVSLCGDMAAEPAHAAALLACGLRTLSVAPARLGAVKAAIARL